MTTVLRVGPFELNVERRLLLRDGEAVVIGARALDVLAALVQHRDRVVAKGELLDLAWPGLVVEESNLAVQISNLRKTLGPQAIATVPGRGYRFVAQVEAGPGVRLEPTAERAAVPTARRTNLPAALAPLIGRADETLSLRIWVESQRLVTVVGAGGIGKSRLAQAVAHGLIERWPDGVWMIELASLADPALIPNVVAQTLGIAMRGRDAAIESLASDLASREMLLVLDNCEHLLEAVANLIDRLLPSAPGLRVLATSQEPLHVALEQQYRINPLPVPPSATVTGARDYGALALFEARVRAADPGFALGEHNLTLAIGLCRHLDGLPLAIELAAARVPLLGLRTVHDRLDERFRLLTAGSRKALRRHQTLQAALDWSHALLSDAQRSVFRRLGVFSGGFTVELAQALCGDAELDDWAVLEHLAALVDKSLVMMDAGDKRRYRLLESARAFALQQLANAGETAGMLAGHANVVLAFLQRVDDANMDGTLRTDAYAALVLPELDNLRAAFAWADRVGGDRVVAISLAAYSTPLGDYSAEFTDLILAQLPHVFPGAVDDAVAARFWRGMAAFNMSGFVSKLELLAAAQRAHALYLGLARPKRIFSALRLIANWCTELKDFAAAGAALDEAEPIIQADWGLEFRITLLRSRSHLARMTGQIDAALSTGRESVRLAKAADDWRVEVIERTNYSDAVWQSGRTEEAVALLHELLTEMQTRAVTDFEMQDARGVQIGLLSEIGRTGEALTAARAALPAMRRIRRFSLRPHTHLLWRLGRLQVAARLLGAYDKRDRLGLEVDSINEERLLAAARVGLGQALSSASLAAEMNIGAGLDDAGIHALLSSALVETAQGIDPAFSPAGSQPRDRPA